MLIKAKGKSVSLEKEVRLLTHVIKGEVWGNLHSEI